jgi:uncharacterized protein YkwD
MPPLSWAAWRTRLRLGAALAAALLALSGTLGASTAVATTAPSACAAANLLPTPGNAATVGAATLCLIDQVRAVYHLRPLRRNHDLQAVARAQANDMVNQDYFSHDSPYGQTPMSRVVATRYPARAARVSTAQDIGWGTGPYATPAHMVAAWMQSPPHRAIILSDEYRDAGVGVAIPVPSVVEEEGQSGATYAVEFGVRAR